MYVTEEDYNNPLVQKDVRGHFINEGNEKRFLLTDIIGKTSVCPCVCPHVSLNKIYQNVK